MRTVTPWLARSESAVARYLSAIMWTFVILGSDFYLDRFRSWALQTILGLFRQSVLDDPSGGPFAM